jgi:hypothetical protein
LRLRNAKVIKVKRQYNHELAKKLTNLGMPCFGCSPDRLPDLLAAVLKGQDLNVFASQAEAAGVSRPPLVQ